MQINIDRLHRRRTRVHANTQISVFADLIADGLDLGERRAYPSHAGRGAAGRPWLILLMDTQHGFATVICSLGNEKSWTYNGRWGKIGRMMEVTEDMRRAVRSELARESVKRRWERLGPEQRREAVKPANEARRIQAAKVREGKVRVVMKGVDELKELTRAMRQ